jgi:hypothetical protein
MIEAFAGLPTWSLRRTQGIRLFYGGTAMANARREIKPYEQYWARVVRLKRLKHKLMVRLSTAVTLFLLLRLLFQCVGR